MQSVFTGPVYVVGDNIDTDQIIPAQYLTLVPTIEDEYVKLGSYALCGLPDSLYPVRFIQDGALDSEYPIVVGGRNFGCGSSREHAPWALEDYGFRAIIAPSFADIFFNNCFKNGLLPIRLDAEKVDALFKAVEAAPGYRLKIDLERQSITAPDGTVYQFEVEAFRKHCLMNGLDDIGLTLQHVGEIAAYEAKHRAAQPWL